MDGLQFARLVVKKVEENPEKVTNTTPLLASINGEVKEVVGVIPSQDLKNGSRTLYFIADKAFSFEKGKHNELALQFFKKMKKTSKAKWTNVFVSFKLDNFVREAKEITEIISTRNGLILCDKSAIDYMERNGLKARKRTDEDELVKVKEDGAEAASGVFPTGAKPTCVDDVLGKTDFDGEGDTKGFFGKDDYHIPQNMLSGEILRRNDY